MSVWLVGGLDPSGGAGLLRDFWAARARAPHLEPRCVVTAFTWQGQGSVARARAVDPARIHAQLEGRSPPAAVKVGLVPDPCVQPVCEALVDAAAPVVVDPVLRASDGGALGASVSGIVALSQVATLVTPNLLEAAAIAGRNVDDPTLLEALESRLACRAVLLKGGHGPDPGKVIDELRCEGRAFVFERTRRPGPDVRGTGCALATAIACELAEGVSMGVAVGRSIAWLDEQRVHCHPGPDGRLHLPT